MAEIMDDGFPGMVELITILCVKVIRVVLDFEQFSNNTRVVERFKGYNFILIETNYVFRFTRVFSYGRILKLVVVGVRNVFVEVGLGRLTHFMNVTFTIGTWNFVNS